MLLLKNIMGVSQRNSILSSNLLTTTIHPKLQTLKFIGRINPLMYKPFYTGYQRLYNERKFKQFKAKQAKMQCDDGYPVHLKGGIIDKILYHVTVAGCIVGLVQCFWLFYLLAKS